MTKNIYSVLGKKETSLTRALASYIIADPCLLISILKYVQKRRKIVTGNISKDELKSLEVTAEKSTEDGRYDIKCSTTNWVVVIEAKIGSNVVGEQQRKKYIERLKNSGKEQKWLICLTEIEQKCSYSYDGIEVGFIKWQDILNIVSNRHIEVDLSRDLSSHIKENCKMKYHDIEIWAIAFPTKDSEKRNEKKQDWEQGYYAHRGELHSPIALALRNWNKEKGCSVIDTLYPVKGVYEHGSEEWKQKKKCLSNCGDEENIYQIGLPIKLAEPMIADKKSFGGKVAIELSFEMLVSAQSKK